MNGTVEGEEVFIPLDQIIGGRERAGFGWNMLMDCLAEGRSISLPAMSVAASKMTASIVGAYARIRKQFKVILFKARAMLFFYGKPASEGGGGARRGGLVSGCSSLRHPNLVEVYNGRSRRSTYSGTGPR